MDALPLRPPPGLELRLPADWLVTALPFFLCCFLICDKGTEPELPETCSHSLSHSSQETLLQLHACRAADIIKSLDVLSLVFLCACAHMRMETWDRWPRASRALCPRSLPSAGVAGGGGGLAEGLMMLREAELQATLCLRSESDWKGPSSRPTFSFKLCP